MTRVPKVFAVTALVGCLLFPPPGVDAGEANLTRDDFHRPTEIPFPPDNPYSLEKAALGKALFFEPRLSLHGNLNCGSCHNPSFGWEARNTLLATTADPKSTRHAPTILDLSWAHPLYWDGRALTVEKQAKGPIQGFMSLPLPEAVARLRAIPEYKLRFERIFRGEGVTVETISAAISVYERTVVSAWAPFDSWVEGDETAISPGAKRGFALFTGKAGCSGCHEGWRFTDDRFHDVGTSQTDIGRGALEPNNPLAQYAFKTPSLRDLTQRSPYMHDGQDATLEDVVRHYIGGGIDRPSRSPLMKPIASTDEDAADIVAFLKTLTGSTQVVTLPVLPN